EQCDFLVEHFSTIMVSYDGMPSIQNKNRTTVHKIGTSAVVERSIERFSESEVDLTIRTTIWQDDFQHMTEMADYILGKFNGNFEWSIRPIIPVGRALKKVNAEQSKLKEY